MTTHGIRDDDALEAQFIAQFERKNVRRKSGGQVVSRQVGKYHVGRHNHRCTRLNGGLEGNHFAFQELFPGLYQVEKFLVGISASVSVSGEMLDTSSHARLAEAFHKLHHHRSGRLRVVGEGAVLDNAFLGIGTDICHRSKIYVKAVFLQISADGKASFISLAGISRSAHGSHGGIGGNLEVFIVADRGQAAAFLVNAQQRLSGKGVQVAGESLELLRIVNVVGEERDAAHGILLAEFLGLFIDGLHLIRHHTLGGLERRVQGFRAHAEKLAHFFPQAHLGKLCFNGTFLLCGKSLGFRGVFAPRYSSNGQTDGKEDNKFFHGWISG